MKARGLLPFLLGASLSTVAWAQDVQGPLFKEAPYVLRTHLSVPVNDLEECAGATRFLSGGVVESGETSSLYAVTVNEDTGAVVDDEATRVGGILACRGLAMDAVEGPGYPTVDREVFYEFDLAGKQYVALGNSRLRTPETFLEKGLYLVGVDATVMLVVDGVPADIVGTMSVNQLVNPQDADGYREGAMITLRLFTGFDAPNYSALIDALRKAGLL